MFTAGSESTSNTVAFAVLHMIRNPECQEKVQAELDSVIGKERAPAYQDRNRLVVGFYNLYSFYIHASKKISIIF